MNRSLCLTICLPFALIQTACSAAPSALTKPALPSRTDILAVMRKAADYQLAEQSRTPADNGWIRAAFYTGVMAAYDATKDAKYLDAATKWCEAANWKILPHKKVDLRFADNQACVQVYCDLYTMKPEPGRIAQPRQVFDSQIADPKPGRVEWWWCDSLFMAPPAFARMAKVTGDRKYLDYMSKMWWDTTDFLYDKSTGLFFRDKTYFDKKTAHGQKVFWSRGNGWVMGGLVRVLEEMPAGYPDRNKFVDLHQRLCATIAKLQGNDGLWRPSLLDPDEFPTGETSGSAFFCYAMAWGINHGTLDRDKYLPIVTRAWDGLVSKVTPEGKLGYVQKVAGAPGKVNPEDTHEYAAGGLLLAGNEMLKLSR